MSCPAYNHFFTHINKMALMSDADEVTYSVAQLDTDSVPQCFQYNRVKQLVSKTLSFLVMNDPKVGFVFFV